MQGIVYTESVVHMPPEPLAALAPYQLVIVEFAPLGSERGERVTGRMEGPRAAIGDRVEQLELREGVRIFRKLETA